MRGRAVRRGAPRARLYVIGPVSGLPGGNIAEFERARRELEAAGYAVGVPHDAVGPDAPWQLAMRQSIREMLSMGVLVQDRRNGSTRVDRSRPKYDGVAELEGIEGSRGALVERALCRALGIPCRPVAEWASMARMGRCGR